MHFKIGSGSNRNHCTGNMQEWPFCGEVGQFPFTYALSRQPASILQVSSHSPMRYHDNLLRYYCNWDSNYTTNTVNDPIKPFIYTEIFSDILCTLNLATVTLKLGFWHKDTRPITCQGFSYEKLRNFQTQRLC